MEEDERRGQAGIEEFFTRNRNRMVLGAELEMYIPMCRHRLVQMADIIESIPVRLPVRNGKLTKRGNPKMRIWTLYRLKPEIYNEIQRRRHGLM